MVNFIPQAPYRLVLQDNLVPSLEHRPLEAVPLVHEVGDLFFKALDFFFKSFHDLAYKVASIWACPVP